MLVSCWSLSKDFIAKTNLFGVLGFFFLFFLYYVNLPAIHYVACAAGLKLVILSHINLTGPGIIGIYHT